LLDLGLRSRLTLLVVLIVDTSRIETLTLLDGGCRNINGLGFRLGLRFAFRIIFSVNTTRVTTLKLGLLNEVTGYWSFNGFREFSLREESG
jgi:hypothetical protein